MPYESDERVPPHFRISDVDLNKKVEELSSLSAPLNSPNTKLYQAMLSTVVRMAQADRSRWDAKIMQQTLREMEHAFSALEPFKQRRKVTVFGSARTPSSHPIYALARDLGATLAKHNLMVITGAGGGIMAAAHEGAGLENSLGFNITLPFEQGANATVHGSNNLLPFHFFFLRKLFFVKEADGLVLCPGGFGTLDEALEVLTLIQTGKSPLVPVVLLDQPGGTFWTSALTFIHEQLQDNGYILPSDMHLVRLAHSAEEAAEEIDQFYRNYHSSRWLKERYIIRLNHALNEAAMQQLNSEFGDLCKHGDFQQHPRCESEQDEPELCHMTRLVFAFSGRNHGRLRQLLDLVNQEQNWVKKA